MTKDQVLRTLRLDTEGRFFGAFEETGFSAWVRTLVGAVFTRTTNYPGEYLGETWAVSFRVMHDHNLFTEAELDEVYCRFIMAGLHRSE